MIHARPLPRLAALTLLCACLGAQADSFTSSGASSASSASVGSLSNSIQGSSNSSSKRTEVAAGEYRVLAVAAAEGHPETLRLTLQATEGEASFVLQLPRVTAEQAGIATGVTVHAQPQAYGLAFARADDRKAFFLVLADDWFRDLDSHPVTL